jgi:hypothetical protein
MPGRGVDHPVGAPFPVPLLSDLVRLPPVLGAPPRENRG